MPRNLIDEAIATPIAGEYGLPLSSLQGARGMNLDQITAEVLAALGDRTDVAPERIKGWVNEAQQEMAGMIEFDELKGTLIFYSAADQYLYKLPKGVWTIKNVQPATPITGVDSDNYYERITDLDIWRRYMDTSALTNPLFVRGKYMKFNQLLAIWPTPISISPFVVDFTIAPRDLDLGTDVPLFEQHWHTALLDVTLYIAHTRLREYETAAQFKNQALASIREKKVKAVKEQDDVIGTLSFPKRATEIGRRLPYRGGDERDDY